MCPKASMMALIHFPMTTVSPASRRRLNGVIDGADNRTAEGRRLSEAGDTSTRPGCSVRLRIGEAIEEVPLSGLRKIDTDVQACISRTEARRRHHLRVQWRRPGMEM